MSYFRSEKMGYYNIVLSRENAWEILNDFGEINALHFVDQDPLAGNFSRPFANYVKRCDEIALKLQFIEAEMKKFGRYTIKCDDHKKFLQSLKAFLANRQRAPHTYLEEVETEIERRSEQLQEQLKNYEDISQKKNHLLEYRAVLRKTKQVIGDSQYFEKKDINVRGGPLLYDEERMGMRPEKFGNIQEDFGVNASPQMIGNIKINCIAGVITKSDANRFNRMVFRVSKGNVFTDFRDIEMEAAQVKRESAKKNEEEGRGGSVDYELDDIIDTKKMEPVQKQVFLIMFTGGNYNMLRGKIVRLCDSFGAPLYDLPDNVIGYNSKLAEVENQLRETKNLVRLTSDQIESILDEFSDFRPSFGICSLIEELKLFVSKEKLIYHTMNMLKLDQNILRGFFWCPKDRDNDVIVCLQQYAIKNSVAAGQIHEEVPPSGSHPPTYFRTNAFTWSFQEIVNTYGIPRYQEVNPGIFTVITFPFLFGVMFGDLFHGALLATFGLFLILKNDSLKSGGLATLLPARYLLFLMGLFAFYAGLIYNDFTSVTINLFGSCYDSQKPIPEGNEHVYQRIPDSECVYTFGVDPIWYSAKNELAFMNSLKMKLAVILGVVQMCLGIFMKALNALHFKNYLDFIFEFVPQIIFMLVTFGWMDAMIIIKWLQNWTNNESNSPSIITLLINMPLKMGSTEGPNGKEQPLWADGGSEQKLINNIFLVLALICIPLMLLPKPLILMCRMKKHHPHDGNRISSVNEDRENMRQPLLNSQEAKGGNLGQVLNDIRLEKQADIPSGDSNHKEEHHDAGEIFVHQIIETIEFVLGSISNTASYLRLWALSLAHSQLAKVFFDKCLKSFLEDGNIAGVLIGYLIFANITFAVLMCMDCMECFLHALRLHWVEFQNKFFKADGYKFKPFSFCDYLSSEEGKI